MFTSRKVEFSIIREACRRDLEHMLDELVGTKAIVWDEVLASSFNPVADYTFLKSHGVTKMFWISANQLSSHDTSHVIFISRENVQLMSLINQQIRMEELRTGSRKEYHLWMVPRISLICEKKLKDEGVYSFFSSIKELPLILYKLETDLLSMEMPLTYRDYCLDEDPTCIFYVARALMRIQALFGLIPNIYGKGAAATAVYNSMVNMRRELAGKEPQIVPQIDQLILIDRSMDFITPLATQLTYEGLIDYFFGINNCTVKLPTERFEQSSSSPTTGSSDMFSQLRCISLSSAEELYSQIRDANFSSVGSKLSQHAKIIATQFDERHKAKTAVELKMFVQKLQSIQAAKQSLATHTVIAELLQDKIQNGNFRPSLQVEQEFLKGVDTDKANGYIEELIAQKESLVEVLRLICLQCVVNNGFKTKLLEHYKKEITQTYGYEQLLTLESLEKAQLLFPQQTKMVYTTIRKTLRLTVDDVSEHNPTNVAYVHSGYAPLSVRLVEFHHTPGWRAITDVLSLLPGPTLCETQQLPSVLRQRRSSIGSLTSRGEEQTVLVFFIGGCTYSEVAALRFLSSRLDHSKSGPDYVFATTKMINNKTFLESFSHITNKDSLKT